VIPFLQQSWNSQRSQRWAMASTEHHFHSKQGAKLKRHHELFLETFHQLANLEMSLLVSAFIKENTMFVITRKIIVEKKVIGEISLNCKRLNDDCLVLKLQGKGVQPCDVYFPIWEKFGAGYVTKLLIEQKTYDQYFTDYDFPKIWLFDLVDGSAVVLKKKQTNTQQTIKENENVHV